MAEKKKEKKDLVADYNRVVEPVENHILTVRGVQVILDRDLADLYDITTKRLNEQVRRNLKRFPASFRFQLTMTHILLSPPSSNLQLIASS